MPTYFPLLTWGASVPPIIWSGVIGAVVALLGVFVANWQNAKRQKDQHAFDAREKKRDRTMAIRKEVYLPLASALQDAQNFLETLAENEDDEHEPITRFAAAVAKLGVVAEMSTAILANKVCSDLLKAYYSLLIEVRPCREARENALNTREYRVRAEARADGTQKEIDKFLGAANTDRVAFDTMIAIKKRDQDMADEFFIAENAAVQLEAIHKINYLRLLTEKISQYTMSGFALLIAVRHDLELQTDESAFLASLISQRDDVLAEMRSMIEDLEKWRIKKVGR